MEYNNPNLNIMAREKYLSEWQNEYPTPEGNGLLGMIVFSEEKIWLERNGEKIKILNVNINSVFRDSKFHEYSPFRVLNSGDWVECFLNDNCQKNTNIGELKEIRLLSPNLKGKGRCSDVNQNIVRWNQFLKKINLFFETNGFTFIQTPTLVLCPGTEPCLDSFKTEFKIGSIKKTMYLPTSPEIHLKKCLAKGWDQIYEIRSCFRNGEISPIHQPEFYLLEWYRAFASTNKIQNDIKELVEFLSADFCLKKWESLSVSDLFKKYLNFELTPTTTLSDLIELAEKNQVDVSRAIDFDEVFFFLFIEKIEPYLKEFECLFVHSYPPSQAALARLTAEGWGDRFELYIHGVEIANAFAELNNPFEQRIRSHEDLNKKKKYFKESINLDEDFFLHLERGMPPASGIALGLERLFMVLSGSSDINSYRVFPISEE